VENESCGWKSIKPEEYSQARILSLISVIWNHKKKDFVWLVVIDYYFAHNSKIAVKKKSEPLVNNLLRLILELWFSKVRVSALHPILTLRFSKVLHLDRV
jgi:hypothetical protein